MRLFMFRNAVIVVTLLVAGAGSAYAADAAHGAAIFKRCAMCHTDAKGAGNGLGPNLFGVVGHEAATHPGFMYSGALKKSHLTWTPANLDKWLTRPAQLVPGTKMMFAGLPNAADRADVIAFLASQK
jgi:cytochrome c